MKGRELEVDRGKNGIYHWQLSDHPSSGTPSVYEIR